MTYYEVLGVNQNASVTEIKTAYRKLVKIHHPDKNPSAESADFIKLINEAYDVLSDPVRRDQYDRGFSYAFHETEYEESPAEKYRREYLRRKWEESKKEKDRRLKIEKSYFAFLRVLSYPIMLFAFVVLIDFFIPPETHHEVAEKGWQERSGAGRRSKGVLISYMQTENFVLSVPHEFHLNYDYYGERQLLHIESTRIFKKVTTVSVTIGRYYYSYEPFRGSVYTALFLILMSGIVIFTKNYNRLLLGIAFLTLIIFILLLNHLL